MYKSQQLAGEVEMSYTVAGCCEDVKSNSGPFMAKKLSWMSCVSRVTWCTADLPCQKPACSRGSDRRWSVRHERRWVSWGFSRVHNRDMARSLFGSPSGFSCLGIATFITLLHICGIFSCRMQEVRKSQNQDLRAGKRGV